MATLTLRPTGAGNYTQLSPSAGNNWQNVDESSADDDSTYNSGSVGIPTDSYATGAGLPAGATGISVTITGRAKASSAFVSVLQLGIYDGGTLNVSTVTSPTLTTSYVDYTRDLSTTNPITSTDWTVDDINTMELAATFNVSSGTARLTQLYATITYTAATPTTVEPSAVSATFSVQVPAFNFSALEVQAGVAYATFYVPSATIEQTGGITSVLMPSAVSATFVVAEPSFAFGTLALTPDPVYATFRVPAAEISIPTEPPSRGPGAWGMAYTRRRRRYGER